MSKVMYTAATRSHRDQVSGAVVADDAALQKFAALPLERRRECIDTWLAELEARNRQKPLLARTVSTLVQSFTLGT